MGYGPSGHKESDTTQDTHIYMMKDMDELQMGDGRGWVAGHDDDPMHQCGILPRLPHKGITSY